MKCRSLREAAFEANRDLVRHGLVIFTWGNVSACDRGQGLLAIKPSGVPYADLTPAAMVLVELETGRPVEPGGGSPSSDTPTHRVLYLACAGLGGVVHTHSRHATAWAQAGRDLPCLGTTHADDFHGAIPCTAALTPRQITGPEGYETNTGQVIVREWERRGLDPLSVPAILVRGHGPFAWGRDAAQAVYKAVVLEEVSAMALETLALSPRACPLPAVLRDKHFQRKHGAGAYYGQRPA